MLLVSAVGAYCISLRLSVRSVKVVHCQGDASGPHWRLSSEAIGISGSNGAMGLVGSVALSAFNVFGGSLR